MFFFISKKSIFHTAPLEAQYESIYNRIIYLAYINIYYYYTYLLTLILPYLSRESTGMKIAGYSCNTKYLIVKPFNSATLY